MDRKTLPIVHPIVASNTEHGYLLAGVLTSKLAEEWLYSNFIHIVLYGLIWKREDMNFYPITEHTTCPIIDYMRVNKKTIIEKWNIIEFLIDLIDSSYYAILHLDWCYVPNSDVYGVGHFMHPMLFFGYDKKRKIFNVADFNKDHKFSFFEISFENVINGIESAEIGRGRSFVNERFLYIDDFVIYRNRESIDYQFNVEIVKQALIDYLYSKKVSDAYAQGDYCYFQGAIFGLNAIKEVINIIKECQESINYKFFTVPLEKTRLMVDRICYMERNNYINSSRIKREFQELLDLYGLLLNMVIKYNITKKTDILNRICIKLEEIVDKEEMLYYKLIKEIELYL